jgi:hypothetical protein
MYMSKEMSGMSQNLGCSLKGHQWEEAEHTVDSLKGMV